MSHLTELMTQLTKIISSSKRDWVKGSELINQSDEISCGTARVALHGKSFSMPH